MTEVNKVVYDGRTLVDLTSDTVTADSVFPGETFHLASGVRSVGALQNSKLGIAAGVTTGTSSPYTVTSGDYTLTEGGIICVLFTYGCVAGAKINVDGTGAKDIYHDSSPVASGVICDGDIAMFMYSGSYYYLVSVAKSASLILDSELTSLESALGL